MIEKMHVSLKLVLNIGQQSLLALLKVTSAATVLGEVGTHIFRYEVSPKCCIPKIILKLVNLLCSYSQK